MSKGWNLIERFSEDIDLAIDRRFFGIEKTNKSQRDKLRKLSRKYIIETLPAELEEKLNEIGVTGFTVEKVETAETKDGVKPIDGDKDPTVLLVHYDSVIDEVIDYIPPQVKIENAVISVE